MNLYRELTDKEIATLVVYGCSADNWKNIQVTEGFKTQFIQNVHFSGNITLGIFEKVFELEGGLNKHSGIYNCILHNCDIHNNVYINKINNYIANYEIQEDVYIENVNLMAVTETSTFGNGIRVSTMVESGGREVAVFDTLSAPIAYIMAFYRHNSALIKNLYSLVNAYTEKNKSDKGIIGKNSRVLNCGTIKNVKIGEFADLSGVLTLENGSIVSNQSAIVKIGNGVQCKNFIVQSGSEISDSSLISNCFIGQGCLIGKQYSASDSLFFANCQALHGEAISIFAGPYTVTHHKSTLMLTALYSFMNAGSGTNFSNHMYKLGPVHQGITERGVKTSSGSYIMWPARIGAFSVVLGKHKGNPDLSLLPFTYIIENNGETFLMPGINLHSAGTIRDVEKWAERDLRKDKKIDPVIFDLLSPYTISKILKGIDILENLLLNTDENSVFAWYQNCKIKKSAIKKGIELYELAVDIYISLIISKPTTYEQNTGNGIWTDLAGLLCPESEINTLTESIVENKINLTQIQNSLIQIQQNYPVYSYNFCNGIILKKYGKSISGLSESDKNNLIEKGLAAQNYLNDIILRDARKEFNSISKTGFGIDGDDWVKNADFEAVRGNFDNHPFVQKISKKQI